MSVPGLSAWDQSVIEQRAAAHGLSLDPNDYSKEQIGRAERSLEEHAKARHETTQQLVGRGLRSGATELHRYELEYNPLGLLASSPNAPRPGCPYGNCGSVLGPHDVCGMTFYIACNMMLAFTLFFFVQVGVVPQQWKTSVNVAGLVTGIAWYNYTYMKEQWIQTQMSPTTYRYTDWLITVPLQIVEFYFILKACGPTNPSLGVKLFMCSLIMVFGGWLAEVDVIAKVLGFAIGMAGWLYIVYEVSAGEAAGIARGVTSEAARSAFSTLRLIVTFGWTIYPIGFAVAYLCYFDQPAGVLSEEAQLALNIIYNLADLINKGAFGLCVWSAAVSDTRK